MYLIQIYEQDQSKTDVFLRHLTPSRGCVGTIHPLVCRFPNSTFLNFGSYLCFRYDYFHPLSSMQFHFEQWNTKLHTFEVDIFIHAMYLNFFHCKEDQNKISEGKSQFVTKEEQRERFNTFTKEFKEMMHLQCQGRGPIDHGPMYSFHNHEVPEEEVEVLNPFEM